MVKMFVVIGVDCENKEEWRKIKKLISTNLLENKIPYNMVDQDFRQMPKTFDIELKEVK